MNLEERLAAAIARAEQAEGARDAFLATASHELRNVVATLVLSLGSIDRGLASGKPADRLAKSLATARRNVDLLRQLLDDMQDTAKLRSGPPELAPEPADLVELVRAVLESLAGKADRAGCAVTLNAPAALPGRWDPERLERVVHHLVVNALRYARGTKVAVTVAVRDGKAWLAVEDGGPGIPPADRERIFEAFAHGTGGGLGLGLFIARRIVEAHGGTIAVAGEPGAGATFTVELPLA